MHELSIAVTLVEMACEKAADLGDVRVDALHPRLGPLSGVVRQALVFSFDVAAEGTAIAVMRTKIGGSRILERPYGELLPRIC